HEAGVTPLTPYRANFTCFRAQFTKESDVVARPGSAAWTADGPMTQTGHPDDQQEEPDTSSEHKPWRRGWHTFCPRVSPTCRDSPCANAAREQLPSAPRSGQNARPPHSQNHTVARNETAGPG